MITHHLVKIDLLRQEIKNSNLDGFLIFSTDEFQNEYVPEYYNRLKYVTNFSGSHGIALITLSNLHFFTDGRYILQARKELLSDFIIQDIQQFYQLRLPDKIGYDPKLISISNFNKLKTLNLISCENLIDKIWHNKPKTPKSKIFNYPLKYAGETSNSKLAKILNYITFKKIDALIITDPSNICWLLNIRANDVEYNPLLLSYAIIYKEGKLEIFSNHPKHKKLIEFPAALKLLHHQKIQLDPDSTSIYIKDHFNNAILEEDPCIKAKACKNIIEQKQSIKIHLLDGIALTKALFWIKKNYKKHNITELSIVDKLLQLRSQNKNFLYPSFATIAGFKDNAAIIHYKPTLETNKIISDNGLLLLDSGGQYLGGTTDITRTILIGKATLEQKRNFTLVLKGHIALAKAIFPKGISGSNLDILARQFLWSEHKDYAHGTGHGVGNCLSVHEGPQRINRINDCILEAGMLISNEPGYYKNNEYGIRLENILLVKEQKDGYLYFETLSLAPIDNKLIIIGMLTQEEKIWLNKYHEKIYNKLSLYLTTEEKKWLKTKTKKID